MILFRGNKSNHGLIRGITGGHFDHAGIIIKDSNDPDDDVTFIEACSDTGVASSSWQRIRNSIGPGKFFEKICVRKVKMTRTPEFYKTVDKIIDEVWQHSYEVFSVKKFARA